MLTGIHECKMYFSVALDAGLSVTALHNHFFFDEPKVYFMHIGGEGAVEKLAGGVRKALDKAKAIRAVNPLPLSKFDAAPFPSENSISGRIIEDILGVKGQD